MESNELRVGNLTEQGEVKSFWERGVHVGFGKCYEFNELKPIRLTEEWFLKFGFIDNGYPYSMSLNVLSYGVLNAYSISKNPRIEISTQSGYVFGQSKIKYVHQLQNLYFALTNEELTIKTK